MQEHFSALPKGAANYVALSPVSFLERAADVHADAIAVVDGEVRRTWGETADRVARVARGLADLGIRKGDTVSALALNSPELFELHFAVPITGGVLSTINTRLEAETIAHILDHSDSQLVLVSAGLRPLLDEALSLAKTAPQVVQIGGEGDTFSDLLQAQPWQGSWLPDDEWDAIALNYTSGTSGRPKGVVYHHRGAYLMTMGTVVSWELPRYPVYLIIVPLFHCNNWNHVWMMPVVGGTAVCCRDITAKAKIEGANPALYDGKRIELNVSLQGALRDLLQSASVIQDLPGNIRDQVQSPSGKP